MLKKYRKNEVFRHIFWITVVYAITHGFLLIATGRWWDDWAYADRNWDFMIEVFMQSSLPLHAVINAVTWLFPHFFYRILTFAYFYIGALLFYRIMKKTGLFSEDAAFWIALLYVGIPVNDARIAWIDYAYSFGFLMFWIAFHTVTVFCKSTGKKRIVMRLLSLVLLLVSFDTESIMMLTFIILAYLYYDDAKDGWNRKDIKGCVKRLALAVVRHLDFLFAPIAWYFGDKILFPAYGFYGGHSYIPWNELPATMLHVPANALITLKNILGSYYSVLAISPACIAVAVLPVIVYVIIKLAGRNKEERESTDGTVKTDLLMTFLGAGIYLVAFFPYAVNRDAPIDNTFTRGRDTMLLGIGTAIMLYYILHAIFRKGLVKPVLASLALLGAFHFNRVYLDWQESYYQQLQLEKEIVSNETIRGNDTFLVMYKDALINTSFYQAIGNAWEAAGPQHSFYAAGVKSLPYIAGDTPHAEFLRNNWRLTDYKTDDGVIDGILFVDYEDISPGALIAMKRDEFFCREDFDRAIEGLKNIEYVPISEEESGAIMEKYRNGGLDDQAVYDMFGR